MASLLQALRVRSRTKRERPRSLSPASSSAPRPADTGEVGNVQNEGFRGNVPEYLPPRTRTVLETVFSVFPEAEVLECQVQPTDLEVARWTEEARYVFHERVGVFMDNGLEEAEAEELARGIAREVEEKERGRLKE